MNSLIGLCLLLLIDSSGSIDSNEWKQQIDGTANALLNEKVIDSAQREGLAVSYVVFSGSSHTIIPWTIIKSPEQVLSFSNSLRNHARVGSGATATGDALKHSFDYMNESPECLRKVIDLSTDGKQNAGQTEAYEIADTIYENAIELNVLVIEDEIGLMEYIEKMVRNRGKIFKGTFENYEQSIREKLTIEMSGSYE